MSGVDTENKKKRRKDDDETIEDKNAILIGTPCTNKFIAEIKDPVLLLE